MWVDWTACQQSMQIISLNLFWSNSYSSTSIQILYWQQRNFEQIFLLDQTLRSPTLKVSRSVYHHMYQLRYSEIWVTTLRCRQTTILTGQSALLASVHSQTSGRRYCGSLPWTYKGVAVSILPALPVSDLYLVHWCGSWRSFFKKKNEDEGCIVIVHARVCLINIQSESGQKHIVWSK